MTKPTLYYALFSPPARACMITAKLIGLDVDLRFVDFAKKEHLSEEFIKFDISLTAFVFEIEMTKPTLYYALFSPPARACMITAKLIGLDVDLRFVDYAKKEHLSEEFIKLNPQHQIPVLVDENEPYWDSHAIMAYIVSKYAKTDNLYPKDLSKRARVDQRMHYENGVLFQVIKDLVSRIIYGGETEYNPKTIQNCHTAYEFLEKFLENQNYVVGSELTIADISINTTLITLHRLIPVEKDKYPKIVAWMKRLKSLPDNEDVNEKGAEQLAIRIKSCLADNQSRA